MLFLFLSSYTNTRESLAKAEKVVQTFAPRLVFHIISRSPNVHLCFYNSKHQTSLFLHKILFREL